MIATAINSRNLIDCAEDAAGEFINTINAGNLMDCAGITVSEDIVGVFIDIAIDAGNSMDCVEDTVGG